MDEIIKKIIKKYKNIEEVEITEIIKKYNKEILKEKEIKRNIICIEREEYKKLKEEYKKLKEENKIKIYNKPIEEIIKRKKQNVIYIKGEEENKKKRIYYGDKEISEIVKECEKECEIIIIKVPKEYNYKKFEEEIKGNNEIEIYKNNEKEYYIIIETNEII